MEDFIQRHVVAWFRRTFLVGNRCTRASDATSRIETDKLQTFDGLMKNATQSSRGERTVHRSQSQEQLPTNHSSEVQIRQKLASDVPNMPAVCKEERIDIVNVHQAVRTAALSLPEKQHLRCAQSS